MTRRHIILIRNAAAQDFGGAERFIVFLAASLTKLGQSPIIISAHARTRKFSTSHHITTKRGIWLPYQRWSGPLILLLPFYIIWQLILTVYYLSMFIRLKPAVVHIQSRDDFIAATYAGRIVGARVVWTDHADLKHIWKNVSQPLRNPTGKMVYHAAKLAHSITVVSASEQAEVAAHLPASSAVRTRIKVVYNGCDDRYDIYPLHQSADTITFIIASRLVKDKGIGEAIDAFISLHRTHPDTRMIIAGDGPERAIFKRQAANCDAISFVGHLDDPYTAIRQSHVFLQPTYHEGFSVVLVEASMLEMPIIATAVGGNVEIIQHNSTGILVPAKNSEALAAAMLRLYSDPQLRQKLAKNARAQYLKRFQFDTIVKEEFVPLYETTD